MGNGEFGCILGFIIFTGISSFTFGCINGKEITNKKAIEANVAHYEINPKTGEETFVYDCPNCDK